MKRLTKRIDGYAHGAEGRSAYALTGKYCRGAFESTAMVERLAEYEDLEESGRFVRLPCKAGDKIYAITRDFISELHITQIRMNKNNFWFDWELDSGIYPNLQGFCQGDIGKTVFLDRAEAEKKIKEIAANCDSENTQNGLESPVGGNV